MRRALVLNAAIVAAVVAAGSASVPGPLRMLAAGLVVLVLPGIGWLGAFGRRELDPPRAVVAVVGVSSVASVAGLALLAGSGRPPSPWILGLWTLLVANAGLGSVRGPGRFDAESRWGTLLAVTLAGFALFSSAALGLVPPLEDHDMEVRGTAWGLVTELKPYFLTNREIYLPMAHPILLHGLVAESLVITREIEATRPSYDSAKRAEEAHRRGESFSWEAAWRADYDAMIARPALVGTRAPGVLLASLTLALLFDLVFRLSASAFTAWGAVLLYATFPETIVRSAYAGYFAPAVFAMIAATGLFAAARVGEPRSPLDRLLGGTGLGYLAAAGALMALLDHKTLVFAAGIGAFYAVRAAVAAWRSDRSATVALWWRRLDPRPVALALGFAAATALFWVYGFAVDARSFWNDHVRVHLLQRMILNDLRLAPSADRYAPSIAELWAEFSQHTGWVFLPVALVAAAAWLMTGPREDGDARRETLAAWAFAIAIAFTLTNWRQTKHLMNGMAPLVAAAAVVSLEGAVSGRGRALRAVGAAGLALALVLNVAADVALVRDFGSMTIRGASDIDGW